RVARNAAVRGRDRVGEGPDRGAGGEHAIAVDGATIRHDGPGGRDREQRSSFIPAFGDELLTGIGGQVGVGADGDGRQFGRVTRARRGKYPNDRDGGEESGRSVLHEMRHRTAPNLRNEGLLGTKALRAAYPKWAPRGYPSW